jgi:Ohr subfamily peroxiredoxin
MVSKVVYTAVATAMDGRDGRVWTENRRLDVPLAVPTAFGGKGDGTNPEELFAAGYAACFGSLVSVLARHMGLKIGPVAITAHVSIGPVEGHEAGSLGLRVKLSAGLPELPKKDAIALLQAAHRVCPYSNATRGNIEVELEVL